MPDQPTLFADVEAERSRRRAGLWAPVETPAARPTDPATSHEAAEVITESGNRGSQQRAVVDLVRRYPGCTAGELARIETEGLPRDPSRRYYAIQRRVSEMSPRWIRRGDTRTCPVSGRKATTLWPEAVDR